MCRVCDLGGCLLLEWRKLCFLDGQESRGARAIVTVSGQMMRYFLLPLENDKDEREKNDIIPWLGQQPLHHHGSQSSHFKVLEEAWSATPSRWSWDQHRYGNNRCRPGFWQVPLGDLGVRKARRGAEIQHFLLQRIPCYERLFPPKEGWHPVTFIFF